MRTGAVLAFGALLVGARMILPRHAGVANAIGAVVGQVAMHASGLVTAGGPGVFVALLSDGPARFSECDDALAALVAELTRQARAQALASGVEEPRITVQREISAAEVEGQPMFIEAEVRVTAQGRPRIARD